VSEPQQLEPPPLAWHRFTGARFRVHPRTVGWRVVRATGKQGAQEKVYGANGTPLFLPLDATVEDLRREVSGEPGRYILSQVDGDFVEVIDEAAKAHDAQVEIRAAAPVATAEVQQLLVDQLKEARAESKASSEAVISIVKEMGIMLRAANVAPLEAFKAGMKFAESRQAIEPLRVIDSEATTEEGEMPKWVAPLLEQAKPFIDGIVPILARKVVRWVAEEPAKEAATAGATQ